MAPLKKQIIFYSLIVITAFLVEGCSSSKKMQKQAVQDFIESNPQNSIVPDSSYQIKKGDEIEVLVWEEPKFNTKTTVSDRGTIAIPLIGEIQASDQTVDELKKDLHGHLSQYIKGEINLIVSLRSTNNMSVSVLGMVTRPDNYAINDRSSIFKILSMAGGPNEEANIRNVRIYRQKDYPQYTALDLTTYLDNGEINTAGEVYPGDMVYVPRKENAVRDVSMYLRDVAILFGIFSVLQL